jgi:signal peptidase I
MNKTETKRTEARAPKPKPGFAHASWEWTKSIVVGFLIFIVIRTFLIQTFTIISGSMENTLLVGDFLVLSKSAYGATIPGTEVRLPGYDAPERGDIVVFRGHHEPIDLVKRLVGMPGDTLAMRNGQLYVNGVPAGEPYVQREDPAGDGNHPWMEWQAAYLTDSAATLPYYPTRDNWGPILVPQGNYFMMGDNRDFSLDSRYWGFVPRKDIKGRAVALYFSYSREAANDLPIIGHIRWSRIGDRLR